MLGMLRGFLLLRAGNCDWHSTSEQGETHSPHPSRPHCFHEAARVPHGCEI